MMNKDGLRALACEQRQSLGQQQRQRHSHHIMTLLLEHLSTQALNPQCLLMYRSLPSEVATDVLLHTHVYNLFTPLMYGDARMQWLNVDSKTAWKKGELGVLEPQGGVVWRGESGVTTLLCPLTAFDRQGNRLGMGMGYFDRWLAQYRGSIEQVIGLAFSCQEVAQVPIESHDMPMDVVITEQEVIVCVKGEQNR